MNRVNNNSYPNPATKRGPFKKFKRSTNARLEDFDKAEKLKQGKLAAIAKFAGPIILLPQPEENSFNERAPQIAESIYRISKFEAMICIAGLKLVHEPENVVKSKIDLLAYELDLLVEQNSEQVASVRKKEVEKLSIWDYKSLPAFDVDMLYDGVTRAEFTVPYGKTASFVGILSPETSEHVQLETSNLQSAYKMQYLRNGAPEWEQIA